MVSGRKEPHVCKKITLGWITSTISFTIHYKPDNQGPGTSISCNLQCILGNRPDSARSQMLPGGVLLPPTPPSRLTVPQELQAV